MNTTEQDECEHEWIDVGPDEPGGCGRYCEVCGAWMAASDLIDYDEGV